MRPRIVVLLVVLLIAIVILAPRVTRFLVIDRCLDHGGRWNYERGTCEGERPSG